MTMAYGIGRNIAFKKINQILTKIGIISAAQYILMNSALNITN